MDALCCYPARVVLLVLVTDGSNGQLLVAARHRHDSDRSG
jgi:hypothetical protein